jgi:tetratricopeptide (TPR) repeat protein
MVLLLVIYVREEAYEDGLEIARRLHGKYPRNFILHVNEAQILEKLDRPEQAVEAYMEVLDRAGRKTPNYHKIRLDKFRITSGERLFRLGHPERALRQLEAVVESKEAAEEDRALAHLWAGRILDTLGQRRLAVSHYRRVTELVVVEDSHDKAREYLKRPYRK